MKTEYELDERDKDLLVNALNNCKDSLNRNSKMLADSLICLFEDLPRPRYFRQHRSLLQDSLETSRPVVGLEDVVSLVENLYNANVVSNIRISEHYYDDSLRATSVWKTTYNVLADMTLGDKKETVVIGMCNFYEK